MPGWSGSWGKVWCWCWDWGCGASSVRLMRVAYLQALPNQLLSCCFKPTEKPLNANTYRAIGKAGEWVREREREKVALLCLWQGAGGEGAGNVPHGSCSLALLMRLIICANKWTTRVDCDECVCECVLCVCVCCVCVIIVCGIDSTAAAGQKKRALSSANAQLN